MGFYFQQRRAALLAAAIGNRIGRDRLETTRIAVVGGGATGLSFLLAIRSRGAKQVMLYEATGELLNKGEHASHRLVHPNYNRWPLLGSMDVFTSLPVMNWYAGSADKVASLLRRRFQEAYEELIFDKVKFLHKVEEVTEVGSELKLTFKVAGSKNSERCDLVVIAAGFGDERSLDWDLNDYWTHDPNDFDEDEHERKCTVYGTGDGALIDLLRCCARKPEDAWEIPLGIIARLREPAANTIVVDNENVSLRSPSFMPIERKIQKHEESLRSIAWAMSRHDLPTLERYAEAEESFYRDCVRGILKESPSIKDFIERRLKLPAPDALKPVLCGTLRSAFEPTAAPINKLLLAYLLESSRVQFSTRTRKAQEVELKQKKARKSAGKSNSIDICRFGAPRNFPSKSGKGKPQNSIRVKLKGGVGAAIETDVEANLIDALSGITGGGYIYFDDMPDPQTEGRHYQNPDGITQETLELNIGILRAFAKDKLAAKGVEHDRKSGPKWVIFTDLPDAKITATLKSIGGLDGNFLGVPIVVSRSTVSPNMEC